MIKVDGFKPFYARTSEGKLRIGFAYQDIRVVIDDESFDFIPTEANEIVFNLHEEVVENLSDVFVFQKGKRFMRIPLYQFILVSDLHAHLAPLLQENKNNLSAGRKEESQYTFSAEVDDLICQIEQKNIAYLIDRALAERNEALFYQLTNQH